MKIYFFKKEERLCNRRLLNQLYHEGSSFLLYPFRVTFFPAYQLPYPSQVVISAPKKRFKRAVDRNIIKRRMREAYRLQKATYLYNFLDQHGVQVLLSLQYIGKEINDFDFMFLRMKNALIKFQEEYAKLYLGKDN